MNLCKLITIIGTINTSLMFYVSVCQSQEDDQKSEKTRIVREIDYDEAVEVARDYLKSISTKDDLDKIRVEYKRVGSDNKCPMQVSGQNLWLVDFGKIEVMIPSNGDKKKLLREVVVVVDVESGNVIRSELVNPDKKEQLVPEPSARSAKAQLATTGPEEWFGVAEETDISLYQAMEAVDSWAGGMVAESAQLIIYRLQWHSGTTKSEPKLVWSIDCRGIAPIRHPDGVPLQAVNHLRSIVDASTGKWIMASSVPQPGEVDEASTIEK